MTASNITIVRRMFHDLVKNKVVTPDKARKEVAKALANNKRLERKAA